MIIIILNRRIIVFAIGIYYSYHYNHFLMLKIVRVVNIILLFIRTGPNNGPINLITNNVIITIKLFRFHISLQVCKNDIVLLLPNNYYIGKVQRTNIIYT